MNKESRFAPGFRISALDAVVVVGGAGWTVILSEAHWQAALIVGFAVGHFFLFCNVFRIARKPELIWAGVFVALTAATVTTGFPGWAATLGVSLGLSGGLIIFEMRKPDYHGVGWKRINPRLRTWWDAQLKRTSEV